MPRAGLSTPRVVAEAGDLADEVGLGELTLAALADRVGVRLPSLYRHVAGAADLRRLLAVDAKRELAAVLAEAGRGRSGLDALTALAAGLREWALQHPGRFAATRQAPAGDDPEDLAVSTAAAEALFAALADYPLEGHALVDAARTVRAALDGFVTIEAAGGFGLERPVPDSVAWMLRTLDTALRTARP